LRRCICRRIRRRICRRIRRRIRCRIRRRWGCISPPPTPSRGGTSTATSQAAAANRTATTHPASSPTPTTPWGRCTLPRGGIGWTYCRGGTITPPRPGLVSQTPGGDVRVRDGGGGHAIEVRALVELHGQWVVYDDLVVICRTNTRICTSTIIRRDAFPADK
jgi:hypothetical protein